MVVNFCLPHFQTTVQCNKLCADGYDASNLLAGDPAVRRKGFKLEYFLRPPAHIALSFQVQVELCRVDIELWPWGMDQGKASRRLEIFTCSESPPQHQQERQPQEQDCGHFKLVGRCDLKDEVLVCFRHPTFRLRAPFPEPPPDPPPSTKQTDLWGRGLHSLSSVTYLKVSIPYGGAGSALGIKSLAVWGLPARCCPPLELEKIKQAHYSSLKPRPVASAPPLPVAKPAKPPSPDLVDSDKPIPEEFLDPLTQELMVLPMILPSGMVVDISTLEEYQRREATWGRPPNDPFTGVPFTSDSKPVPNPLLKGRIDSLVLKTGCTGVRGKNGFRTRPEPSRLIVPSNSEEPSPTSSTSLGESDFKITHTRESERTEKPQKNMDYSAVSHNQLIQCKAKKRPQTPEMDMGWSSANQRKRVRGVSLEGSFNGESSSTPSVSCPSTSEVFSSSVSRTPRTKEKPTYDSDLKHFTHEQRLSDSLDEALNSALLGLPRFTSQSTPETGPTDTVTGENKCGLCLCSLTVYPTSPAAYSLPCGHLLCRPCLQQKTSSDSDRLRVDCPTCSTTASPSAIIRVHH
ncbi:RING finger protein 37 [Chanos chanos]|uniref:RING finger protein 37 n=1 Tax=Chanos chanos TaxID=29144 RepID=A0A6J2ULB1_CHACN|nr:RING finger protein 37 [Chanos chanos]